MAKRSAFDELFDILEQSGAKVTLYGKPTNREEVRRYANGVVARALGAKHEHEFLTDEDGCVHNCRCGARWKP